MFFKNKYFFDKLLICFLMLLSSGSVFAQNAKSSHDLYKAPVSAISAAIGDEKDGDENSVIDEKSDVGVAKNKASKELSSGRINKVKRAVDNSDSAALVKSSKKISSAKKMASELVLVNGRTSALTDFVLQNEQGKDIVKLKKTIKAGDKATLKFHKTSTCVFSLQATFEDEAQLEQTEVNLCNDKVVRLVE